VEAFRDPDAFFSGGGSGMRYWLAVLLLIVSRLAFGQVSEAQFTSVVCGPQGLEGVTYVTVSGNVVGCGTDSDGNQLVLQISTLSND